MYKKEIRKKEQAFTYYEYGAGNEQTLLFLPGYADSALMYEKLGKSLAKRYKVIALDLPMIHDAEKINTLEGLTNFVKDFVEQVNIRNFTIAGFSSCGMVAINYTYYNSERVKELILLNSVPRFILSRPLRKIYLKLKPILISKAFLLFYSKLNTTKLVRKILRLPRVSRFTRARMREYYKSVFGTALNLYGESLLIKFKNIKVPKSIIFFKDDTIIPWSRYQDFVEKLDCKVIVFSEGLHADKKIYWEKLKSLWLKSPVVKYQEVSIEKSK
jgi:pimeloyl-ACP methyl ester carboxylesterase